MAPGQEPNFNNGPNSSFRRIIGRGGILNESSSPSKDKIACNKGSQPIFHQDGENESKVSQEWHSSSHQPLGNETKEGPLSHQPSSPHYNMENIGDPERMRNFLEDCLSYPSNSEITDLPIVNHSLIPQPVESATRETKELQPLPQASTQNNLYECQLQHSHSHMQCERGSPVVPHARSQPITKDTSDPLPDSSTATDNIISPERHASSVLEPHTVVADASVQYPYSNHHEDINIFVFGPPEWIRKFLQTFPGEVPLKSDLPYSFAFTYKTTRCGISMSVSVWEIYKFDASINFLKNCCLSSKSAFICLFDLNLRFQPVLDLLQLLISRSMPVILVATNLYKCASPIGKLKEGFERKALHNVSAYMECSFDSKEEVEAVMYTAIDVSFLMK